MKKTTSLTRKNLPGSRIRLTIPVTVAVFKPAFEAELADIAKDIRIEGFRPGKAPLSKVLAQVGRQRVEAGALDRALNVAYGNALKEENIVPVAQPQVSIEEYTAPAEGAADTDVVAVFTAEADILPDVSVKGYDRIRVKQPELIKVTDKDVDEVLAHLRKQQAKLIELKDDAVAAKGMWADIGFEGSVGGVARQDMKSEHHPVTLGENTLIPGFEDEVIGMKKGEQKTFDITFPKDYHAKELQGKKAQFTVTLHELKDMQLPPVDDMFAKKFGLKTAEELEKGIRDSLEKERTDEQRTKLEEAVLDELLKLSKFEVPASMVEQEEKRLRQNTMARLGGQPLPEELAEQVAVQSEKNVKIGLMLGKVIEEEKIAADSPEAMKEAMERLIALATK